MIHILTLNWNGLDKLKKLASSLEMVISEINSDVIWHIRDNGSTDGSVEWLKSISGPSPHLENFDFLNPQILFVDHNRNNFAQGVNSLWMQAMQWAHDNIHETTFKDGTKVVLKGRSIGATTIPRMAGDYVLLLNNDIEFVDQNSLKKMLQLMESDPKIGVVGARLLYNGTNNLQHAGVIFGPKYGYMPYHYRHQEESDKSAEKNRYFQAVTAACCLIRVEAMRNLDEGFSWAFEDIDLCLRIGQDGWKIAYCGDTNIYHEESASLKKNPVNKLFLKSNVKRFKEKWFGNYKLDHKRYLANKDYNLIKDGS